MNIQQTILKGIQKYLYVNDYLVLPEFGGFVLKSASAKFSSTGNLLLPPSKTVSFNVQLRQNDGVLVSWMQQELGCSAQEAIAHLREFAEFCTSILTTKRRLTLDGIGFFFLDFENNYCFEPSHDANYLSSSFGLGPISLNVLEPEPEKPAKHPVFVDRRSDDKKADEKLPENKPRKKLRSLARDVAGYAFAGFVVLSLLFLLVTNTRNTGLLHSTFFNAGKKGTYKPLSYAELPAPTPSDPGKVYVADANGIAYMELEGEKRVPVNVRETAENTGSMLHASAKNFQVVVGCFSVLQNAKRMQKKMRKQHRFATISTKNEKGLYVVSCGEFDTHEEASGKLEEIKTKCPKAWIKHRAY